MLVDLCGIGATIWFLIGIPFWYRLAVGLCHICGYAVSTGCGLQPNVCCSWYRLVVQPHFCCSLLYRLVVGCSPTFFAVCICLTESFQAVLVAGLLRPGLLLHPVWHRVLLSSTSFHLLFVSCESVLCPWLYAVAEWVIVCVSAVRLVPVESGEESSISNSLLLIRRLGYLLEVETPHLLHPLTHSHSRDMSQIVMYHSRRESWFRLGFCKLFRGGLYLGR
jgi:hypothetical protein